MDNGYTAIHRYYRSAKRHANDDIGGYYHSASGTPDNTVRGRYGSRSPASGQIEETVYTAGPRGWVIEDAQEEWVKCGGALTENSPEVRDF